MNTALRLAEYYPFEQATIEVISDVAEQQATMSRQEFMDHAGFRATNHWRCDGYKSVEIADFRPNDHDTKFAVMVHLAMANALDKNQLYQLATVAAANPTTRFIAVGNPGAPGSRYGTLNHAQRLKVAHGDYQPTVEPLIQYTLSKFAEGEKLEVIDQVGFSLGTEKAFAASNSDAYSVQKLVEIEPVAVKDRRLAELAIKFTATGKALQGYVDANELPPFIEARKQSPGLFAYTIGLGRLTNIAVAKGMTKDSFFDHAITAMNNNPEMVMTVARGSKSELAKDKLVSVDMHELELLYGADRIRDMRLDGQKHNLVNDLALQSAIIYEGLRK